LRRAFRFNLWHFLKSILSSSVSQSIWDKRNISYSSS
jgi:hypothetical protein